MNFSDPNELNYYYSKQQEIVRESFSILRIGAVEAI